MDQLSYALGLGIGHQLLQMNAEGLNIDDFAQAIKDVMTGGELKMKEAEAQQMVQQFFAEQEALQQAAVLGRECKERGGENHRFGLAIPGASRRKWQATQGYRPGGMPL